MFYVNKLAVFLLTLAAAAPVSWQTSLETALAESRKSGNPIFMDFQAPWCYSCYYMEEKVLSTPAFAKEAERLVLLKLDVDTPEGRAIKERFKVTFLPTYVMAGADQKAIGRIIGEQKPEDFMEKLVALRGGPATPQEKALSAQRQRLAAADYAQPSRAERKELESSAAGKTLLARLRLMRAIHLKKSGGAEALKALLATDDSCELAYDVVYGDAFLDHAQARPAMEQLVEDKVFKGQCADFRTGIEVLAEIYEKLGLKEKRAALILRAIAALDDEKIGKDRNHDDNLRFFLELSKDAPRIKELYVRLASIYETDYVYPYRFARYLLENKEAAAALPWIEKADRRCYGANRLSVTKVRAKILAALDRKPEAQALLAREIKAGKSFPTEVASLAALLKDLSAK